MGLFIDGVCLLQQYGSAVWCWLLSACFRSGVGLLVAAVRCGAVRCCGVGFLKQCDVAVWCLRYGTIVQQYMLRFYGICGSGRGVGDPTVVVSVWGPGLPCLLGGPGVFFLTGVYKSCLKWQQ